MSEFEQFIEDEIKQMLQQIESQEDFDKIQTVKNLLDKYIHLSKSDFLIDFHDFNYIISHSKLMAGNDTFPIYLEPNGREINNNLIPAYCIINSTIGFLNSKECLRKLPRFKKSNK